MVKPHNVNSIYPVHHTLTNCFTLSFLYSSECKIVTQSCRRLLASCPNFMIAIHCCWQEGVCLPSDNLILHFSVEPLVAKANLVSRTRMEKVSVGIHSHYDHCCRDKRGISKEIPRLVGAPSLA